MKLIDLYVVHYLTFTAKGVADKRSNKHWNILYSV